MCDALSLQFNSGTMVDNGTMQVGDSSLHLVSSRWECWVCCAPCTYTCWPQTAPSFHAPCSLTAARWLIMAPCRWVRLQVQSISSARWHFQTFSSSFPQFNSGTMVDNGTTKIVPAAATAVREFVVHSWLFVSFVVYLGYHD